MISLEDIWYSSKLQPKRVPGFNFLEDGRHYARIEDGKILVYDIVTGEATETIFDTKDFAEISNINSYIFSPGEDYILVSANREKIYRHSFDALWYVFDRETKALSALNGGQVARDPLFSPDGLKIGYSYKNDLYYFDLIENASVRITDDGKWNHIINGTADWVYEEEFAITRLFDWSADSRHIAWLRLDETEVPEYIMPIYQDKLYPKYQSFKYPKVGEVNSRIDVVVYDTEGGAIVGSTELTDDYEYIPRIHFTKDPEILVLQTLNRHQNNLKLLALDLTKGNLSPILEEKSDQYVDVHDNLSFLDQKGNFIWTSERSGYNHIYMASLSGSVRQITKGDYDVTQVYGVDEENGKIYFQAAMNSPLRREVYAIDFMDERLQPQRITPNEGYNSVQFSTSYEYYVGQYSNSNTPPVYTLFDSKGEVVRILEDNANLIDAMTDMEISNKEFLQIENREGTPLNAYIMKPQNMEEGKAHPTLMFLYGGPGSQQVMDAWDSRYFWWFQHLNQKGYVVACVDNRGTGARGADFKKQTYLKLGELETADQIDAAQYLGSLDYIDAERIGIFGWSYGGYMSTNSLLLGEGTFKLGIAVAPVTNWKWYDNVYTERYMRTLEENEKGYRAYSPIYHADKLKGDYLLIHGTGDDNVHFQHSVEMANALINADKDFETMYYPNRDHGIYGGKTRLHLFRLMTDFIDRKL